MDLKPLTIRPLTVLLRASLKTCRTALALRADSTDSPPRSRGEINKGVPASDWLSDVRLLEY